MHVVTRLHQNGSICRGKVPLSNLFENGSCAIVLIGGNQGLGPLLVYLGVADAAVMFALPIGQAECLSPSGRGAKMLSKEYGATDVPQRHPGSPPVARAPEGLYCVPLAQLDFSLP